MFITLTVFFLFVYYRLSEKILNCEDMAWIQKRFTIIVNSASKQGVKTLF